MPEQTSGLTPTSEDMAWYEKTKENNNDDENLPLGKRPIDALEKTGEVIGEVLSSSPSLRFVGQTLSFVNENLQLYAKEELDAGRGQLDPAVAIGSSLSLIEDASNVLRERATAFAEDRAIPAIEQATGQEVDPRAAGLYGEAVGSIPGELASAGLGKAAKVLRKVELPPPPMPKLQTAGATVSFNGMQAAQDNVFRLTLKDPENIPRGVKQGSAWSDEWAGQSREYFARRAAAKEKLQSLIDAKKKKNRIRDAQADLYNDASTGWTRDPEGNPIAFGKSKFKEQSEVTPLTKAGNPQMKEQHHLFTKQESYQFIERMSEIGDDDDLLAMFLMAEDMDAAIGGRFSNMLNVEKKSHQIGHSSRIFDGRQIKADEMSNLVSSAKSTDELMTMFRKYIIENVRPSADEARALEIIGSRLHKMDKYKYLDELYDKMYRSPDAVKS